MPTNKAKKRRCARGLDFSGSAEISGSSGAASEPTPGPSGEPKRGKSLVEALRDVKKAKAADAKNMRLMTKEQKAEWLRLKDAKQVGNYKLPDAPPSKGKGKGKGKGKVKETEPDHRRWITCPLLPGVPTTPPPRLPQTWQSHVAETAVATNVEHVEDVAPLQGPIPETTVVSEEETLGDVIEGTPPSLTSLTLQGPFTGLTRVQPVEIDVGRVESSPLRAKKRRIRPLSPSTGVVQATELPANPMFADVDIELVNFTPSSSTTRNDCAGSGRSIMSHKSLEIDVDVERDIASEPNSGSEIEEDDLHLENIVDISLRPPNPRNTIGDDDDEPNPTEAVELMNLDAEEDRAIRNMAVGDEDVLNFDWCGEYTNFTGVRETFTGPSGPTFDASGMSPLQIFEQIWDNSILDHIVQETNNYAQELKAKKAGITGSRISRWKPTTRDEMRRFFAILMLQSVIVNNVEREYWYPKIRQMQIGDFGSLMPFNRFLLLKRCIHFANNLSLPEHPSKLDKIKPIVEHLNGKFTTMYLPEQIIAIDESLLLWKGRLSFSQKIATKRAREGIKSYELCESRTGYLWRMEVYSGKGHVHAPQEADTVAVEGHQEEEEPENATAQIVFNLMRPLFGKGHTVVMDNFYNSPLLSRLLKSKHKTDTMGTLRLNREFVPEALKVKTKQKMKSGEVCFSTTKDLCVLVFMDQNCVPMISTFHRPEVDGIVKYGYYKYKPKVILDYNLSMGGIDRKDQMLSSYPIERSRNLCWYKKLFRRLLNVSILNSSVIHNHGRTRSAKLNSRSFRIELLNEMLERYCNTPLPPPPQPTVSQMHLPVKVAKSQRCKLCYKHKVRRTTVWSCGTCRVNLCIEGCYIQYHRELTD